MKDPEGREEINTFKSNLSSGWVFQPSDGWETAARSEIRDVAGLSHIRHPFDVLAARCAQDLLASMPFAPAMHARCPPKSLPRDLRMVERAKAGGLGNFGF